FWAALISLGLRQRHWWLWIGIGAAAALTGGIILLAPGTAHRNQYISAPAFDAMALSFSTIVFSARVLLWYMCSPAVRAGGVVAYATADAAWPSVGVPKSIDRRR